MGIISEKEILSLIIPKELAKEYDVVAIVETEKYIEMVLKENNRLPKDYQRNKRETIEVKQWETQQWLTFPLRGKQCRLKIKRKRWIIKPTNNTVTNKIPSGVYGMKISEEFGIYLKKIIEMQVTDIPRIARIMRLCPNTLRAWYQRYLTKMESEAVDSVVVTENIGTKLKIDEVSLHRGDFWTILSNSETKKACAIIKGTKVEELGKYLNYFSIKQRYSVREITLDMSNSFDWIAREYFPNALRVIDRFHVQRIIYDAVQEMRVQERKKVIKEERESQYNKTKELFSNGDTRRQLLARSRGLLFKSDNKWTDSQKERAKILFNEYLDLKNAYVLSQQFKHWYDKKYSRKIAKERLNRLYEEIEKISYPSLLEAIETIKRHEGDILNYFKERSTNAYAESLNSKIKLFKTLVRGINKPEYFIFRLATYIT